MQLAQFIRDNHESILAEWEAFARTLLPASGGMSKAGLRDHAEGILTAIVKDMESLQSVSETSVKAQGHKAAGRLGALGELHALLRIESGFKIGRASCRERV